MLYINGEWLEAEGNQTFKVTNPANGEFIAQVANGQKGDVAKAIDAANHAFKEWKALTAYQRAQYLYRAYELMIEKKEHLARTMTEEQGKPLRAARNEVQYGADFLLWYAEEAKRIYGEIIPAPRKEQRFLVLYQPVGVVGAITPWNYPISMITRKVAPALAAGCTVVVKPAEQTPLCAIEVFKIFDKAGIPAGVVNLIPSKDPVPIGEELINNPNVKKITFTGSTEVGKILAQGAAKHMKRVSMELGGHAPFIVCEDADPVHAAKGASLVKFLNSGQACISPNRIFVHKKHVEAFTNALVERVKKMKVGNGMKDGTNIGPLIDHKALEKMQAQVDDALSKGALVAAGGGRVTENGLDKGFFFAPTVLTHVNTEMRIYREETFGPIAPIIPFETEEEVLEMANDTHYGLAAYVYSNQLSTSMRMFEQLNFGIIGINDINPTAAAVPFGGMKESGWGREGGKEGIFEYLEAKAGGFSI
ncbi:succinate-semialdehyde dehydrogenase/glutarate-semialdehyde dehydrogenase [Caldalkalibacillus uzonensis]|uniref:Succinate-semialdehyde dehydrogenase/glutarate-semialdehyde dehydrogenase n=1 Tax=Caldalkalibacillus uzonensis TaxID=353224 RepID=A0ABU0CRW9_9BACI|nr:NAD-dependent succinate-semialdehyde dehydrogenase [Caldalkalibacillus uzonensis]MDQ0338892.1 succinate-semialdehyde dehydrogenase/glutarate-semialdehyde dehydrogenase [Caldalkalibacillus uzonensis]